MNRSIWFSVEGVSGEGALWCNGKCNACSFRFACFTICITDQIKVKITPEQYDKWITPHFCEGVVRKEIPLQSNGIKTVGYEPTVASSSLARGSKIMNIQKLFKPYFVNRKNGQCQVLIPLVELDELCDKIEKHCKESTIKTTNNEGCSK